MSLEIMTAPVISTAHLTPATHAWLDAMRGVPVLKWDYGWLLYVGCFGNACDGLPADLGDVIRWAQALDYEWVRFDVDALVFPALPAYEDT